MPGVLPASKAKVKAATEFHGLHNQSVIVPERYRAGIKALGAKGWMYLGEFMMVHKINPAQGAAYRDMFKDYILEADKKMIICGSAKLAKEFREAI